MSHAVPPRVEPVLRPGARVLLVGEAPGEQEEKSGEPFIGPSGKLLFNTLGLFGLSRADVSIINVCPHRPPNNDIKHFWVGTKPGPLLEAGKAELHAHIATLKPAVIVALGNTALWGLVGKQQITDRRGSIYEVQGIPVVASLHPAAVLRDPTSANLFARDLSKVARILRDGPIPAPSPRLVLFPTDDDLQEAWALCHHASLVAVDIEGSASQLTCVGFSPSPDYSICIPATSERYRNAIEDFLMDNTPKVFHNAPFDVPYLVHKEAIPVFGELHDTLMMAQALHPELPRDLGTLISLYTDYPYFKDLRGFAKLTEDAAIEYRYNALDTVGTRTLADILLQKLDAYQLREVYERKRRVLPHALAMSMRGIKYDTTQAVSLLARNEKKLKRWQKILNGRAGAETNVASPTQVAGLLYKTLKLPKRVSRTTSNPTTNEKALMALYAGTPNRKIRQVIRAILEIRGLRKMNTSYLEVRPGEDYRMRSSFNPSGTETGRWTASKYLINFGTNLQTVPSGWKPCFVADDGMLLWNADYSQIEARLVAYFANDERQIEIFEGGGDIHRQNASVIFNKTPEEVTSRERDIGKTVHALNYGVGVNVLMETVNKRALETGVWLTPALAKHVRQVYLDRFDKVVAWQESTWQEVQRTRKLTNPFGRTRIFLGPTMGDYAIHTKKEALAFRPQSTVPDLLDEALIDLRTNPPCEGFEVLLNIHDALFGQAPAKDIERWLPAIKQAMMRPFTINGRTITIPVDIKVGPRWSEMKKV